MLCIKICSCGKMCDKMCSKIETLLDYIFVCVVVDIDSLNIVVVCGKNLW